MKSEDSDFELGLLQRSVLKPIFKHAFPCQLGCRLGLELFMYLALDIVVEGIAFPARNKFLIKTKLVAVLSLEMLFLDVSVE